MREWFYFYNESIVIKKKLEFLFIQRSHDRVSNRPLNFIICTQLKMFF